MIETRPHRISDPALSAIVVACCATSVAAFLLDAYNVVRMPFTISFVALPALVLTLAIAVWARRRGRTLFLRRLYVGAVSGVAATLAYDALRGLVAAATPSTFDPFRAHPNFGALMLSTSPATTAALVAGWAYHVWNGLSFAVMYALIAGGARYYWALAWAMCLETATILVYPTVFGISRSNVGFIAVSLIGHVAYGMTLGILTRQWLRDPVHVSRWSLTRPSIARGLA